jgi:hypothetical protein
VAIAVVVAIVTALLSRFFELTAPLLGLAAMFAVMPLGVSQRIFGFVDPFFALLVAIAVKGVDLPDAAEQEARHDQCSEYSGLPKPVIQNSTSKLCACVLQCWMRQLRDLPG